MLIAAVFTPLSYFTSSFAQTRAVVPQPSHKPTFYRDILPILQDHCQSCHRPGEIAPMSFVTYEQVKPWAPSIRMAVESKSMPPWFADPRYGKFSNDPSLTPDQIKTVADWVDARVPAGSLKDAPRAKNWTTAWNIPKPDKVVQMPVPVAVPAHGDVEYTYEIVPTGFAEDRWVQFSEIRPSNPQYVHHAVIYVRPPNSTWL